MKKSECSQYIKRWVRTLNGKKDRIEYYKKKLNEIETLISHERQEVIFEFSTYFTV